MIDAEWETLCSRVVELPDQGGILVPADAAESAAEAMLVYRRYARDVWGWPDDITNAGIDGPHNYVCYPPRVASLADYRDAATAMLRGEKIPLGEFDEAVAVLAEQMARDSGDPGGWRRSMFIPPDVPSGRFWNIRSGFVQ